MKRPTRKISTSLELNATVFSLKSLRFWRGVNNRIYILTENKFALAILHSREAISAVVRDYIEALNHLREIKIINLFGQQVILGLKATDIRWTCFVGSKPACDMSYVTMKEALKTSIADTGRQYKDKFPRKCTSMNTLAIKRNNCSKWARLKSGNWQNWMVTVDLRNINSI